MRFFRCNPFGAPPAEEIAARLRRLQQHHPGLSRAELARLITGERAFQCALAGALTAVPAILPGMGTLLALFGGVAADITLLTYLLSRLVLEIAALYGRDLTGPGYQKEAFWAFILASGAGSAGNALSRAVVAHLSKEAFSAAAERLLLSLGVRASARSAFLRLIPLAGLFLAGGINYWLASAVGRRAATYYEEHPGPAGHGGPALDAEFWTEP
ncbi:MAG: EcsC family protein [Desulfotomaculales bacterium]